jgi:hypothetical protein
MPDASAGFVGDLPDDPDVHYIQRASARAISWIAVDANAMARTAPRWCCAADQPEHAAKPSARAAGWWLPPHRAVRKRLRHPAGVLVPISDRD